MPPLDALGRSVTLRAATAQAAAASAARQSRGIGIATVLVTIAIGNALGAVVLRLLGRAFRRVHQLMSALGRLGDRDELLGRLRAAADQLVNEQRQWSDTAERLDTLVSQLDSALQETSGSATGPVQEGTAAVSEA